MAEVLSRANKYGAKKVEKDGFTFASKAEARRYDDLKLLQQAGQIWSLRVHPQRYPLIVNGQTVGHYTPDFEYCQTTGTGEPELVTEDVKGRAARDWPLRKRLFAALYGRQVREIRNGRRR
jgi:hypothetical protein